MYGNTGKLLRVDLSKGTHTAEDTAPYFRQYLGGRAMNHILLFRDMDVAKVKPFDGKNEIIFSSGPLGGTTFPSSGRLQATFIAPLPYSGWGDSNVGGAVGPYLKFAGWDAVIISGKAEKPVYLYIEDDRIALKPAKDLWGKGIDETMRILTNRHPGSETLLIGQAGEKLVRYANIRTHRTSSLGRCGGGAVMGSKNLKGLVVRGSKGIRIFDPEKFMELSLKCQQDLMDPNFGQLHSTTYQVISRYGTTGTTRMIGMGGATPIKNWRECGLWAEDGELTQMIGEKYWRKHDACYTCPVHCHGAYRIDDPEWSCAGGGPEYETTNSLGSKCLEPRAKVVLKLNSMCNDLGLDTIETGNMFACLMDWYEKGIIDDTFTDGIPMRWGNGEGMIELVEKIAGQKSCGRTLAEGPYRVGKELGEEALRCVFHQKGMAGTGGETRSGVGIMLANALSPRGLHHLSGLPTAEWVNNPAIGERVAGFKEACEPQSYHPEAKARVAKFYEELFELSDSLGICKFNFGHMGYWHDTPEDIDTMFKYLIDGIYYATGTRFTEEELLEIGDRAYQIERATIVMRGIKREDDLPNWRGLNEECPGEHPVGPVPLPPINLEKYNKVLDRYYQLRGWTNQGIPTRKMLQKLDLEEVADALEKKGIL